MTAVVSTTVRASASPATYYLPAYAAHPGVTEVRADLLPGGCRPVIFRPALEPLLGEDAAGKSPASIGLAPAGRRQKEHTDFRHRYVSGREYVLCLDGPSAF
jgi:hypothetical protein